MVFAINTRILSGDIATRKFLLRTFTAIASENPPHQFYFISENEFDVTVALSNVQYVEIKQQSSSPLLWKLWYNYKLPSLLRKIKADVLISADGICSLRTKLPQCLLVNDLEFISHPEWYNKKYVGFAKSTTAASLAKVKSVITFSEYLKNAVITKYKTDNDKIEVIAPGTDKNFQPLHWNKRETIKKKYAEGNEYFLFCGAIHERNNLTNLLKAFSLFKKRQKSSMQLLLITDFIPEKNAFVESLRLYKYRNDVKLLSITDEKETGSIVSSAWCCINLSPLYSDINFLLSALQCEVPVIAGNNKQAKELLEDAAFYANPAVVDAIAEQMMLVYKDENKRNEMIEAGKTKSTSHNLVNSNEQLWQYILAIAKK